VLSDLNVPLTVTAGEVTAGDYDFSINVDGIISGTISIPEGTYNTAPELATALQTAINSDSVLAAAGRSVSVDFDLGLSTYGVISSTTGSDSSVNFTALSANMISQFGFAIGGGTQGTEATGELNDAAGLRLRVIGGAIGTRGTVSYIQGTAFKLSEVFDNILDADGLLDIKVDSLSEQLIEIQEAKVALDERIAAFEAQLVSQFTFADGLISQLNTTQDFLTQQLDILSQSFKRDD
jgi:flagellar hook-associated protein 2